MSATKVLRKITTRAQYYAESDDIQGRLFVYAFVALDAKDQYRQALISLIALLLVQCLMWAFAKPIYWYLTTPFLILSTLCFIRYCQTRNAQQNIIEHFAKFEGIDVAGFDLDRISGLKNNDGKPVA